MYICFFVNITGLSMNNTEIPVEITECGKKRDEMY